MTWEKPFLSKTWGGIKQRPSETRAWNTRTNQDNLQQYMTGNKGTIKMIYEHVRNFEDQEIRDKIVKIVLAYPCDPCYKESLTILI